VSGELWMPRGDTTPPVDVEAWWLATAKVTAERDAALATIERVWVLLGSGVRPDPRASTHSTDCHRWHYGCLVRAIRAALEPSS